MERIHETKPATVNSIEITHKIRCLKRTRLKASSAGKGIWTCQIKLAKNISPCRFMLSNQGIWALLDQCEVCDGAEGKMPPLSLKIPQCTSEALEISHCFELHLVAKGTKCETPEMCVPSHSCVFK